ncbi:hypothetical protein D3C87_1813730 [compost metagenome]
MNLLKSRSFSMSCVSSRVNPSPSNIAFIAPAEVPPILCMFLIISFSVNTSSAPIYAIPFTPPPSNTKF